MYNKLRYNLLHQRAHSSTCETLAGKMVLQQLEFGRVSDDLIAQWRAKRNDYAAAPQSLPFLVLDYMANGGSIDASHLDPQRQRLALDCQRHWNNVVLNVHRATTTDGEPDARAVALLAALNTGAWLDAFLWRDANRATPINVF